jgi:hypothetical protein
MVRTLVNFATCEREFISARNKAASRPRRRVHWSARLAKPEVHDSAFSGGATIGLG